MIKDDIYKHWQCETDKDGILWVRLDREDREVNALNIEILSELKILVTSLAENTSLAGLVITSAKNTGFIVGADIHAFTALKSVEEAAELIRLGQAVFNKLAGLAMPTLALINGICLGGGMELALACRYRLAQEDVRLGLPEVKVGIYPGWGGAYRLPALLGPIAAMDMMLTGKMIRATDAAKMGLIDAAIPTRQLENAARYYILNKPPLHQPNPLHSLLNNKLLRPILAKILRKKVAKQVSEKYYPAPYALIRDWERYGTNKNRAGEAAVHSNSSVFSNKTAHNLIRLFFLQERLKAFGKVSDFEAKHVHVIGAGIMGGDIAAWCVLRGCTVTLQDQDSHKFSPAIKKAYQLFKKNLRTPHKVKAAMDRLIPDVAGHGVGRADLIIEAIFENLEVKQQLFQELEKKAAKHAILATNTSSIPLDDINKNMRNPERLVGIHFFNPVAQMMLVEVVSGEKTSAAVAHDALAFVRQIDKLPLPVKSSPGFLINRVLMPYLLETGALVEEGIPLVAIDKAMVDFGMPMGPIELGDTVGLDICLSVAKNYVQHFGGEIPPAIQNLVDAGKLGRKSGEGFYKYVDGKKQPMAPVNLDPKLAEKIVQRLTLRIVNETVACLREKVVDDGDLADAGMVFATGFAPYTGGPLNYAKSQGFEEVMKAFEQLTAEYGDRFKADDNWRNLQQAG